jgi:hypothetical protein
MTAMRAVLGIGVEEGGRQKVKLELNKFGGMYNSCR